MPQAPSDDALAGLRVLVVGASSGIGAATAALFVQHGARVVGAARRTERVQALGIDAVHCDLTDPASCEQVVGDAVALLGGLDALVVIAGLTVL